MDELVLYYDITDNRWRRCNLHKGNRHWNKYIVMRCDDLLFLYYNGKWKIVAYYDELCICATDGTKVYGVPALFAYDGKKNYKIPILWRIKVFPEKETVVIYSESYKIEIPEGFNLWQKIKVKYHTANCTYDLVNGKNVEYQDYEHPSKEIIKDAYEILKIEKRKRGIKIPEILADEWKTNTYLQTFMKIFAYGSYDGNRYYMLSAFHNMKFIPLDCTDIYPYICEKLQINPPDEVKKAYRKNPYVLLIYKVLLELEFQNMRCMEIFFNGKYLGPIDFSCIQIELPFLAEEYKTDADKREDDYYINNYIDIDDSNVTTQEEIDALLNGNFSKYSEWEYLKFAVSGFIERKGEAGAVKFLQQYTQGSDLLWQNDLCRIIYEWYENIPTYLLDMFFNKGLERSIYDKLVTELVVPAYKEKDT